MYQRLVGILLTILMTFTVSSANADTVAPDIIPEPQIPSVIKDLSPLDFRAADAVDLEPTLLDASLRDSEGREIGGLEAGWGDRCPEGYLVKPGGICEKVLIEGKKFECPVGYALGTSDEGAEQCERTLSQNASKECPTGYTLSSDGQQCEQTETIPATPYCTGDWSLNGETCERTVTTDATYSCPDGYALNGTSCSKQESQPVDYECPNGYVRDGTTCTLTETEKATYECPTGYSLEGTECKKLETQNATFTCPDGYTRDGTTCNRYISEPVTYSCPAGYVLDGSQCKKLETQQASYSCPDGYTRDDTTCTRYVSEPVTYSCPTGYTRTEDQCYQKDVVDPTFTCTEGYTLSPDGTQCESLATAQVACPDGYTYENGACQKLVMSSGYACETRNGSFRENGYINYCDYPENDLYAFNAQQECPSGYKPDSSVEGGCLRTTSHTWSCPAAYEQGWVENHGSGFYGSGTTGCASVDRVRSDDQYVQGSCSGSYCFGVNYYMNPAQGTKTCPSGYSLAANGNDCVNPSDTTAKTDVCNKPAGTYLAETYHAPVSGECFYESKPAVYNCGTGGSVNRDKYSSITASNYNNADVCYSPDIATGAASCDPGYEVDGELCSSIDVNEPDPVCNSGYVINSETGKCETVPTQSTLELCPSGYKLENDGSCSKTDYAEGDRCAEGGTYAADGGPYGNGGCEYPDRVYEMQAAYQTNCPSGEVKDPDGICSTSTAVEGSCPSKYEHGYGAYGGNPVSGDPGTRGCGSASRQSPDDQEVMGVCFGGCPPPTFVNEDVAVVTCPAGYTKKTTWNMYGSYPSCYKPTGSEAVPHCSYGYSGPQFYDPDAANETCFIKSEGPKYSCPTGYVVNTDSRYYAENPDDTNYRVKASNYHYRDICFLNDVSAASQGCADGYIPDGSGACINATLESADAQCPSGYTRNGDSCVLDETTSASANCPSGYTFNGSQCEQMMEEPADPQCPAGYTRDGTNCVIDETESATPVCAEGYSWTGSQCERLLQEPADPVCPNGYTRDGNTCTSISTITADSVCPTGYTQSANQCTKTTTNSATPNCPVGYNYTSGGICDKDETKTANYQCDAGYNLDNTECWRVVTESYSYECSDGTWALNGDSCSRLDTKTPERVCPEGYTDTGIECELVKTEEALRNNLLTVKLPKVWPGSYTLAISVKDESGNANSELFELNYQPQALALRNGATKLDLPAVQHPFKWEDGAATLVTEPIEVDGALLDVERPIYAGVSAEAESGYNIAGVDIAPGDYKQVFSGYDFELFEGSLELPMYPLSGEASTSDIIVSIGGTGEAASVIQVDAWTFTGTVNPSKTSLMQIFEDLEVSGGVGAQTPCALTGRADRAQDATELKDPFCLIEWNEVPAAMSESGQPPMLQGRIDYEGTKQAGFTAYLVDDDGTRIEVGTASASIEVKKAMGSFEYKFAKDISTVLHTVEDFNADLDQVAGPSCRLTMDEDRAIDYAQSGYGGRLCFLEWFDLPGTLAQAPESSRPRLRGRVYSAGQYQLGFRVFSYTSLGVPVLIAEQTVNFEAVDPPRPSVEFTDGDEIIDGLYQSYIDGGRVASALIKSKNADLQVVHQANNDVVEDRIFQASPWSAEFATYQRIESVATGLWQRDTHSVSARFVDLPSVADSASIETLSVPSEEIGPVMHSNADYVLNDDVIPVDIRIGHIYQDELPYDASTMGEWEIRVVRQETYDTYVPLTDWQDHDAQGKASVDIDLSDIGIKEGYVRLYAQARVKSPVPEYERLETSTRPIFLTVLYGGEIDADIDGRRISGPVPFRGVFKLDLSDRGLFRALGDVTWKMSSDGGNTWVEKDNNARNMQYFDITLEEPGKYMLKAQLNNRNSGIAKETTPIEIVAYRKPEVSVDWRNDVFIGDEVILEAGITVNGVEVTADDVDIEWSNDGGETFEEGGLRHTFERTTDPTEPRRERWEVRVKALIAPDDDPLAWTIEDGSISYRGIRGPRLYIQGPRVTEVGKAYKFDIYKGLPYSRMEYDIKGYFTLPDGTQVPGDSVTYTPSEEDLEKRYVELSYTGWVDGWKDEGAVNTDEHALRIWEYRFPEFIIYGRYSADVAPVEATLYARPDNLSGRLEEPEYVWDIPPGVEVIEDTNPVARKILIPDEGNYEIGVTVTDRRNNEGSVTEVIEVGEPEPYELSMRLVGSNEYHRAPYEVLARPDIDGGHPRDKVVEYNYTVDGEPMDLVGRYGQSVLEAGEHTIRLEIVSEFGLTGAVQKTITVYENQPPACELEIYEGTFRYTVRNICDDPDGYVRDYQWWINGEELVLTGYRISIPKENSGNELVIESRGTDDSGLSSDLLERTIVMPEPKPPEQPDEPQEPAP